MSRSLSCFGFVLCLAGALGAAHRRASVPALDAEINVTPAPVKIEVQTAFSTRDLDLLALTLSDFGDEEK